MSRHIPGKEKGGVDVRASGMMVVRKKIHKDLDGGILGTSQVRSANNIMKDPRLIKITSCMASQLSGKKPGTLGKAQDAFKAARSACKY
mgnify:CR=1 FL=1